MSKEYNFVFSAFVVLFFGCLFIFLSSRVVFDFIVCIGFCFFERICARWKVLGTLMKVFRLALNFSELF
jgi:hypothetical protein